MISRSRIANGIDRAEFRRGFFAILPLWLGAAPFAFAFAVLARERGLSALETWLLSAIVFAGAAQLAFIDLVGDHAGAIAILGTVLLLNLRHVLYGLSLNNVMPAETRPRRPLLAFFMTDESYGLTIRDYLDGRGSPAFFFGSGVSLFAGFTAATAAGATMSRLIPDPEGIGLDFVFPLCYLAILLPLLRKRVDLLVAAVGGGLALGLSQVTTGGITVLIATSAAAALGALLNARAKRAA